MSSLHMNTLFKFMLLCSKKRSAGVTIDCLVQRHRCLAAQLTNVNQKRFCYPSVIWMVWNLNLNECEQRNHIMVCSSDSQEGVLKQVPGGPWKDFNFTLLNLWNRKDLNNYSWFIQFLRKKKKEKNCAIGVRG